ncbi:unnamed protein product [Fraxinus pennsylvanica]|uniref:Thioredoxin domain-containing protein n=1 Tax=Fraxinus pennsylvanica TaxID=56036 RepID=A0AAD2ABU3_9LAMI|nr:unnamed protein product [Fraxinus pennsylvanica]
MAMSNSSKPKRSVSRKNTVRVYKKRKVETPQPTVLPQNGVVGEAAGTPEIANGGDTITSTSDALVGKSAHTKVWAENVKLAKVDATEENELAEKYEAQGYPTVYFFVDGEHKPYSGQRTKRSAM